MPSILSLDKEKKLIYEHFFNFLAEIRIFCSNIPLKKKDFPLFFKLKHELKQGEMPNFIEIENVFLKTQERCLFYFYPFLFKLNCSYFLFREKKFKSKWQKEEIELFLFVIFYLSKKMGTMPENFVNFFLAFFLLLSFTFLKKIQQYLIFQLVIYSF